MTDRAVWVMPHLSQECRDGPVLRQPAYDCAVLAYDYESESGDYEWAEIRFPGTAGVRFTFVDACTPEQVAALDRVVEVDESDWAGQLREPPPAAQHLRIFFDDVGCYEFLLSSIIPPSFEATSGS